MTTKIFDNKNFLNYNVSLWNRTKTKHNNTKHVKQGKTTTRQGRKKTIKITGHNKTIRNKKKFHFIKFVCTVYVQPDETMFWNVMVMGSTALINHAQNHYRYIAIYKQISFIEEQLNSWTYFTSEVCILSIVLNSSQLSWNCIAHIQ